jgi:hypothetical protein
MVAPISPNAVKSRDKETETGDQQPTTVERKGVKGRLKSKIDGQELPR